MVISWSGEEDNRRLSLLKWKPKSHTKWSCMHIYTRATEDNSYNRKQFLTNWLQLLFFFFLKKEGDWSTRCASNHKVITKQTILCWPNNKTVKTCPTNYPSQTNCYTLIYHPLQCVNHSPKSYKATICSGNASKTQQQHTATKNAFSIWTIYKIPLSSHVIYRKNTSTTCLCKFPKESQNQLTNCN